MIATRVAVRLPARPYGNAHGDHRGGTGRPDGGERVTACSDRDILTEWLRRAVTVGSAGELLD